MAKKKSSYRLANYDDMTEMGLGHETATEFHRRNFGSKLKDMKRMNPDLFYPRLRKKIDKIVSERENFRGISIKDYVSERLKGQDKDFFDKIIKTLKKDSIRKIILLK